MRTLALLVTLLLAATPSLCHGAAIDTVHVLFLNHLDVGFSGGSNHAELVGFAAQVVDLYFNTYFPAALAVAEAMAANATSGDRFVYTTKAWLVSLYVDCPAGLQVRCPSQQDKERFEAAIRAGVVRWHAFPFNTEVETMDVAMVTFALQLVADLDARYGVDRKTVWSQRDVPGTTVAALKVLQDGGGVRAVSFGINGASATPDVPSVSLWQSGAATAEPMLMLVHKGGYGGIMRDDCHMVDGFGHVLCLYFKNDNDGPPGVAEVQGVYAALREQFPEADPARVVASSFEAFVDALLADQDAVDSLPVVTEEIGDTWIHGMAADPLQTAQVRAIMAERTRCLAQGECVLEDYRVYNFSRLLLKAAEHTHGGDVKRFLHAEGGRPQPQYFYWSNDEFHAHRDDPLLVQLEDSWREQRAWCVTYPIEALQDHPLAARLYALLATIGRVSPPDLGEYEQVQDVGAPMSYGEWTFGFDVGVGAINHLANGRTGQVLADAQHLLGHVQYQTLDEAAYDEFMDEYMYTYPIPEWALFDYGKLNLTAKAAPERAVWQPRLVGLYKRNSTQQLDVAIELAFDQALHDKYGAPLRALVEIAIPLEAGTKWTWSLSWFGKQPTRIPETLWFAFNPIGSGDAPWHVSKLGQWVDLGHVRLNGSWHLHAVDLEGGVRAPATVAMDIVPLDSILASFGVLSPFPTPLHEPDWALGVAFKLVGNIWGTNYAMWYPYEPEDADAKFRFETHFTR